MPPRKREARPEHLAFQQALGQTIRTLRKPGMNQDDFADVVGVYRSHMGLIEQGKLDVRLSTLLALAEALDLPLSELLWQVEQQEGVGKGRNLPKSRVGKRKMPEGT